MIFCEGFQHGVGKRSEQRCVLELLNESLSGLLMEFPLGFRWGFRWGLERGVCRG